MMKFLNKGKKSEKILKDICNKIFGEIFVAKTPKIKEKSGEKELTDVLVNLDDEVVFIQSKSIQIQTADLDNIKNRRILKKIEKAKIQMNTALNAEKIKAKIEYTNGIGVKETIDWNLIKNKHGIITLNIEDQSYEDPEHRFQIPWFTEEHRGIHIHYFILRALYNISYEYDTPWDFLQYLKERKRAKQSIHTLKIGNELDFAAFIKIRYDEFEKSIANKISFLGLEPGLWEEYVQMGKANKQKQININDSVAIENLLYLIKKEIENPTVHCHSQEVFEKYKQMTRILSQLPRSVRRDITRKMQEKYDDTNKKDFSFFLSIFENFAFFTVFVNENNKSKRQDFLDMLCIGVAKKVHSTKPAVPTLLAICEKGAQTEGNEPILWLGKIKEVRKQEIPKEIERLFGKPQTIKSNDWEN